MPRLYFVKLDVRAAFDTIPQAAMLALISKLPSHSTYGIARHMEIKAGERFAYSPLVSNSSVDSRGKPLVAWKAHARAPSDTLTLNDHLESKPGTLESNTVVVENIVLQRKDTEDLLTLLHEHISNNIVKIGKKFYRQSEGIPQGSVVSSLLCNYFYAELESKHLSFLQDGRGGRQSLLVRLIDDFLLVTTDKKHAREFLDVMLGGVEEYGVCISKEKTLVNFEVGVGGAVVGRVFGGKFPYCGSLIDIETLDICREGGRRKGMGKFDILFSPLGLGCWSVYWANSGL